ncbi:Probable inactive receptor kinase At1g48480 [Linum perenne]
MRSSRDVLVFLNLFVSILITACLAGDLSSPEAEATDFFSFIKAVDPHNNLQIPWNGTVPDPCKWDNILVRCFFSHRVTEIRLQNLNLSGKLDADSLCRLPKLHVVNLAGNSIQGNIPDTLSSCRQLRYLNLSSNLFTGRPPLFLLSKLKHINIVDISNNSFKSSIPRMILESTASWSPETQPTDTVSSSPSPSPRASGGDLLEKILPVVLGIAVIVCIYFLAYSVRKRLHIMEQEKETLKTLAMSPQKTLSQPVLPQVAGQVVKKQDEEMRSEFVFFVEEKERFNLGELLESAADLQNQTICSSLYKVVLKDSAIYAVKRLKKLAVSFDEFSKTMRQVGNLKHPNILPLIAFSSNNEEKLLIYKYQTNGSLSNLQEGSIDGKRDFPWTLRLSIASGIAKGLGCIYHQNPDSNEPIPHGNLKPSNIMLNENDEPVISEYGYAKYRDPNISTMFASNGYTAPEKTLSEKGDVYSFGIILLELLTGKTVEKSGINLPKWVRSMVREEWTGEVFDRRITNPAREYAFHLLNIALKCVSSNPEDRPTIGELVEKFEEVSNANEDVSISSMASTDQFSPKSCCLLHSVIPETWDTPGSNY